MKDWTPLTSCVACGSSHLEQYFDAGQQPLANSFHDGTEELPVYPLGLNACLDCHHSQNLGVVNPDLMFRNYPYVSGTTKTLTNYFSRFVDRVERDMDYKRLRVLDIASNDGSLLWHFQRRYHDVQGIDPALNLSTLANEDGISTLCSYWNLECLDTLRRSRLTPYDVIVAMNVLGHVADPEAFLKLAADALDDDGKLYIQTSQTGMFKNCEFDTVYHEHISFFEISSFMALARRCGLSVESIHIVPIHGGSFLVRLVKSATTLAPVVQLFNRDLSGFQRKAEFTASVAREQIHEFKKEGYACVGFGAAAKANTFLNFSQINLSYMIDENPLKQNRFTPGMSIPVYKPEKVKEEPRRIAFVLTAWNFKDEIIHKIRLLRPTANDIVMTYFPSVTLSNVMDDAA